MSKSMAQNGAEFAAVDPSDLEEGDEVIVDSIHWDDAIRGTVHNVKVEAGRYGIDIDEDPDGLGNISRVWEESGRTWYRVQD